MSLIFLISHSQGGADRTPPFACQGAEVGRSRPHEAALIEDVAGGQERGDGGE
jgi:hypothetical protein